LGPPLFNRSDLRPITVGGHPATIAGVDAGSPDDVAVARIEVAWGEGDTATRVVGIHMSPADVLSAAEHVGEGPRITAAGLPDGFEELGRGPLSYRGNARGKDELGGLTLTYRLRSMPDRLDEDGNVPADAMTQIQITQRPGTADEFPMMQLGNPEVVETEALGEPAYSSLGTLELFDPGSQQIVTISGTRGPHGAELERVAEGLRPVALAEVEQLIAPFVLSGPPPLAAGETLLAQGTEDGAWWRVLAVGGSSYTVIAETPMGRTSMRLTPDGPRRDLYLNLGEGATGRTRMWFLFGTVRGDAIRLTARFPDASTQTIDLQPFPDLLATDAAGTEIARLTPDDYADIDSTRPGPMGTTDDPTTTNCAVTRTFPDTTTYCLQT
jgi:hypothetical protein